MGTHVVALADRIAEARRQRRLLEGMRHPNLRIDDAYATARELLERRVARGERRVGWKIGYTSAAMREQMGVTEPNFGPLTDAMMLSSGQAVSVALVQPRVEPEVLVVLARTVHPGASRSEVAAATASVHCALEVVDSVWSGYRFTLAENTADGSSAAHLVTGPAVGPGVELDELDVALEVDGLQVGSALGSEAMGHPFDAVSWLAGEIVTRGGELLAGDLIMTGGLMAAVPLSPGSTVRARFGQGSEVSVRRRDE